MTIRESIVATLEHVYGPLLIGVGFAILYLTQDPAHEVILGFLHELSPPGSGAYKPFAFGRQIISLTLLWSLPIVVWSAATFAVRQSRARMYAPARWIPVLAGIFVFYALARGTWAVATGSEAKNLPTLNIWMFYFGIVAGFFYGSLLHAAVKGLGEFALFNQRIPNKAEGFWTFAALVVLILPVLWIGFFRPVDAYFIGPVGIASVFAISACYFLSALTVLSSNAPHNIPLVVILLLMILSTTSPWAAFFLTCLALAALVLWLLRWWRNNEGAPLPLWLSEWRGPWTLTGILMVLVFASATAFLSWTPPPCGTLSGCNLVKGVSPENRGQKRTVESFKVWQGRSEPTVRLVAAQGGGLYAAYHTAYYLAARADEDPNFAESVFAISGVSGGSVGAAVFWAIVKSGHCQDAGPNGRCHRQAVQDILRYDFLSPTLAAFLFRDAFDTVIPISYLADKPIDRANVLENLFADRVDAVLGTENLLRTGLADSWAPDAGVPVLMLNSTEVGTGERRILSPLPLLPRDVPARIRLEGGKDLTVGNAMTISARFPFVTPPARVRRPDQTGRIVVRQLVDGGYFDNSGIETLIEAISDLAGIDDTRQLEVLSFNVEGGGEDVAIKGLIAAAIGAFTGAWRARRDLTGDRLTAMVGTGDLTDKTALNTAGNTSEIPLTRSAYTVVPVNKLRVCSVKMFEQTMNFTVSWYLTPDTFQDIEVQMDDLSERMSDGFCSSD